MGLYHRNHPGLSVIEERFFMKKIFIFSLFSTLILGAAYFSMSCSINKDATAPDFQGPVLTLVAINPSLTPTNTFTNTPTTTATNTPTCTPTPTP